MDENVQSDYTPDSSTEDMMWTDYDYQVNTGELSDWYPGEPAAYDPDNVDDGY